jgi:hypothetical protein
MSLPILSFSPKEVSTAIARTKVRKASGYDLITGKVLQELPRRAITLLTILYNRMLHLSYYPLLWKFAQIIMVPKTGKPIHSASPIDPLASFQPSRRSLKTFYNDSEVVLTSQLSFQSINLASDLASPPFTKRTGS